MSTERSRTIWILLTIAVIAGGAGFWFFKIYAPGQSEKSAQAEVAGWETRWTAARACLLGPTPGSTKTSEALAIRELTPDPWDRAGCAALMAKLNRGEADDSGIKRVEQAWATIDHAATKAAGAFATHLASPARPNDPLPTALDELDAARAALRTAVKLPVVASTGTALRAATLVPIADGETQMTEVRVRALPNAHGYTVEGVVKDQSYQIALRTGTTPVVSLSNGVYRSVPDATWGAGVDGDSVEVGGFDPKGVMTGNTAVKLQEPEILAVIGPRDHGEVVYANATQLEIARVASAGPDTLTATPDAAIAQRMGVQAAVDADGRAAIVWSDGKTATGRILKTMASATDEAPVTLGENPPGPTCLTSDRAWLSATAGVLAFGGAKPMVMRASPFNDLLGCTQDAALFRLSDPADAHLICTDDCRVAKLPSGAPAGATLTVIDSKLVAIATHGGVVGVWREDAGPPVFFSLPAQADPLTARHPPSMRATIMAQSNGTVIDVLARGAKGFVVIRIPIK